MITQVEVTTPQGASIMLPLNDPASPFSVEDMQGLDPVKATLVSSGFATLDGAVYRKGRRETRNITIKVGFNYNPLEYVFPENLRKQLYNFFMPKTLVNLRFYLDSFSSVEINGVVEACYAPPFTSEPKANISIICFDSDFLDYSPILDNGMTVSDTTEEIYEYEGSIETGFEFDLMVDRSLSAFTIYNRLPDNTVQTLEINSSLVAGDIVSINTVPRNKAVIRTRSGVASSILYAMTPQSTWLQFYPGENNFRVYAAGAPIPYHLKYIVRYGGL